MKQIYKTSLLVFAMLTMFVAQSFAQQSWWGLWNSTMELQPRCQLQSGTNDQYVRLTAQNSPLLVGGKISAVRFWIYDKTTVESASVWISTSYSKSGTPNIVSKSVNLSQLKDLLHDNAPTEVDLGGDFDVLPEGNAYANVYVGFSLNLSGNATFYQLSTKRSGVSNTNYLNGSDIAKSYGMLPLQVVGSGPKIAQHNAPPQVINNKVVVKSAENTLSAILVHAGYEPLQNIDYALYIDGEAQAQKHFELAETIDEIGITFELPVSFISPANAKQYSTKVKIMKINGQDLPSELQENDAEGELIVLDRATTKRTVMEEFTGTWCHNCVRGLAGIRLLSEAFGDRFIPVAVHGDNRDPMMIDDYYTSDFFRGKISKLGGYPSCTIDRLFDCDPYCGYAATGSYATQPIVEEALSRMAVADINVSAAWTDDSHTAIDYLVTTDFCYNSDADDYSLVLILTADGLEGPGRYWQQSNGYNNYTGTDEALLQYAGVGEYLPDFKFDHAAIAVVGVDGGIDGSISKPIVAGKSQQYTYRLDVSDNELVQDPSKLHAVVLLLNGSDGSVANAATSPVSMTSGIGSIETNDKNELRIYDMQGRPMVSMPAKGIYIIGGKKVVVK